MSREGLEPPSLQKSIIAIHCKVARSFWSVLTEYTTGSIVQELRFILRGSNIASHKSLLLMKPQ